MAKYIKTYCPIKDCYGLATIEVANGKDVITNYQPILVKKMKMILQLKALKKVFVLI